MFEEQTFLIIGNECDFEELINELKKYPMISIHISSKVDERFEIKERFKLIGYYEDLEAILSKYGNDFNCSMTILVRKQNQKQTYVDNDDRFTTFVEMIENNNDSISTIYGKSVYSYVYSINYSSLSSFFNILITSVFSIPCPQFNSQLPRWTIDYFSSWFGKIYTQIYPRLNSSCNHYCKSNNLILNDKDFKFLGQGGSNTVLLCQTTHDVLRISEAHREFKPNEIKMLKGVDSGFEPIKEIVDEQSIKYIITQQLKPIKWSRLNDELMDDCLNRFIRFMKRHDLLFTDFWHENFLQSLDETKYYISDIDMEDLNYLPDVDWYNDLLMNKGYLKASYNQEFYSSFCAKHNIKPTKFIFCLISVACFKISNYRDGCEFNSSVENKILEIVKSQL